MVPLVLALPIKVHLPAESRHVHLKASERGKPYWSPPRRSNDSGEIATDTACIRGQSSPGDSSLASSRASDQSAPPFVDTYVAVFQEQLLLGQHSPPGFGCHRRRRTWRCRAGWSRSCSFLPKPHYLSASICLSEVPGHRQRRGNAVRAAPTTASGPSVRERSRSANDKSKSPCPVEALAL